MDSKQGMLIRSFLCNLLSSLPPPSKDWSWLRPPSVLVLRWLPIAAGAASSLISHSGRQGKHGMKILPQHVMKVPSFYLVVLLKSCAHFWANNNCYRNAVC